MSPRHQSLTPSFRAKLLALVSGGVCQISFFAAVAVMAIGLHGEMTGLVTTSTSWLGTVWNCLLLLLFPVLHSLLLGSKGRKVMAAILPGETGRHLVTTTFVTIASLQLIALFLLWSHLGGSEWRPHPAATPVWQACYVGAWLLLAVSMVQAGLGVQMGLLGWTSVLRGVAPHYPSFRTTGLYTICRQPVYFSMALVSCTGPVWNLDHAIIAAVFTTYCVVGPMFKERRLEKHFGAEFKAYRENIPFFPTPRSIIRALCLFVLPTLSTRAPQ
jgi:protein-S-isoprenylcysteine O-methyltransferase Ste14